MRIYHNIILFSLFIIGCSSVNNTSIADLSLPQKTLFYINDSKDFTTQHFSQTLKDEYLKYYFSAWQDNLTPLPKKDMFWGLNAKNGFDESKKPIDKNFFNEIESRMQIDSYPSLRQKAIMVKTANVRVLPTNKPRFSSIDGYPFDRWQNSLIFAFTPVIILHEDSTKEWVLIQSSFVSGWVKSDEVALVSDNDVKDSLKAAQNGTFMLPLNDEIPLYHNNQFITNAHIGMLFQSNNKNEIYIYRRNLDGSAMKIAIPFDKTKFGVFPLIPSEINISNIIDSLIPQNYGWGGMYENRDCSAFIRDVFANFGIWLPRNSLSQVNLAKNSTYSTYLELPTDSDEKIAFIKQHAKPFRTIIWLKGHIMLYIGEYNDTPMVIHDAWSVNTSAGEQILGGINITTLSPGAEKNDIFGAPPTLLDRIEAINILID